MYKLFNVGDKIFYKTGREEVKSKVGTIVEVHNNTLYVVIDGDSTNYEWHTHVSGYGTHFVDFVSDNIVDSSDNMDTEGIDKFLSAFSVK